jgi:hypothetical protein
VRRFSNPITLVASTAMLLAAALAVGALSACGGGAVQQSPSWTPAPKVTAAPQSFHWASPTEVHGMLLPGAWTSTASFRLPAGPATVVGILKVPHSTAPRFTARLLPVSRSASFPGYGLSAAGLWHMPMIRKGEGAIAGWFAFTLPAGRYRLLLRETSGSGPGGSYDLYVSGVK